MGRVKGDEQKLNDKNISITGVSDSAEVLNSDQLILRVGIIKGADKVDFQLVGTFNVADSEGKSIISSLRSEIGWRAEVTKFHNPKFKFYVHLKDYESYDSARTNAETLKESGYPAKIVKLGKQLKLQNDVYIDSRRYRLIIGYFKSEEECIPFIEPFIDKYNPRILKSEVKPASGLIEFCDYENNLPTFANNSLRIIPDNEDCSVIIREVKIGAGFHWEKSVDRKYPGIIEIRVDPEGKLWAINEIPIDMYLKSVVPSEMPASYPMEALKAQAIAARSIAFSHLFLKHPDDPFDICADVHCQAYSGINSYHARTDSAVIMTSGEVVAYENQICDAVYASVCGGHTENRENVWFVNDKPYLRGRFDDVKGEPAEIDLSKEDQVKRWINSDPDVFCNVSKLEFSTPLLNAQKYFRWSQSYTTFALEKIIKKKTGVDIGLFYGIVPLERGVSGRLIQIEILGSKCNHKIRGELNIRRALSESYLRSSCFYNTLKYDTQGIPVEVIFHGAGWGHGVGMCQVGAAVMAEQGFDYREILRHYYQGTEIKKAYDLHDNIEEKSSIYINQEILEE